MLPFADNFSDERKKAMDEAIIASIGDGLIATDKQGKIILINPVAEKMLLLNSADILGKDYIETVPATDINGYLIPAEKRPINLVLETGQTFTNHAVNSYVRADGTRFPAAITTSPIIYEGKTIGAIISFRDSTREREIDAMKSNFLSVAAHQLRTPLGTIRWNLEMIIAKDFGPVPAQLLPTIQQIYDANIRMITLVNDLLNVARIDELRVQDNPQVTNIEEVIAKILLEKKGEIDSKNLMVSFIPTRYTIFNVMIDRKRLVEILENMITNAIKYNIVNGSINIKVENIENYLKITFSDTGIGITKNDVPKITSKFFRASNAVRSETEGSGLGLFVVKSYLEDWGGKLEFSSKEGMGSTFIIYLPQKPQVHMLDMNLAFKP